MKSVLQFAILTALILLFAGCASDIQRAYWSANTGVASEEARNENYEKAEKGDSKAQYQLANMYMDGKGVEQDFTKAIQLYELSASQGFTEAQHYLQGRGGAQDREIAIAWLKKSADQGYQEAGRTLRGISQSR